MRNWLPWLVAGGAVGLLLARRNRGDSRDITTAELDALMTAAYAQNAFNLLIENLATTGGASVEQIKQRLTGPLEVMLDVRASGIEKFFAGDISDDVRSTAVKIAQRLASACPGAPKLAQTDPAIVRLSDISSGFRVRLVWPAVWGSTAAGFVREQVRACIEELIKISDPELGERLISTTARRL